MKDYSTDRIRNICLMSHGGAGKTSLVEAMLFNTGVIDRLGKVVDGTTTADFDPEEIKRQFSINTTIATTEYKDYKLNIIDTPGYFDFVGEVRQGIRVADAAVIVVAAKAGVEVGTEKAWALSEQHKLPKIFFVNKIDEENANFFLTLEKLRQSFGKSIIAFAIPIIENGKFTGYIDVVEMKAYKIDKDTKSEISIPENLKGNVDEEREHLLEGVAETSEELMEKYFSGEQFSSDEIDSALRTAIKSNGVIPVYCGSATNNSGVYKLMDAVIEYLPSPADTLSVKVNKPGTQEAFELKVGHNEPLSAIVFKTIVDPFVGRISLFRVYSGTMKSDSSVYNAYSGKTEKISQLFILRGKKQLQTDKLFAGDIGAVAKLQNTNTNNTLCDASNPIELEKIDFPNPMLTLAIQPKEKGDEEKIGAGLTRLQEEDPTFKVALDSELRQILISGVGEQHIDVIISKLKAKFGASVDLADPKVPYRETIRKKVKVEGKHKKQSGGHGQYGHVWIEFEPGETEQLTFEEKIFGGSVPKQYVPAVEKGLQESIKKGVLAGYPVVNLKATLVDGSYHTVDSSEMAFKIAASLAYKKGLAEAQPILLEPIAHVEVTVPDNYMGDIIGDLNKKRGRILGMNPLHGGLQQVVAEVPQAEMFKYAIQLRSMTQGRGEFDIWFERYEEAPTNISSKVMEDAKKDMAAEEE